MPNELLVKSKYDLNHEIIRTWYKLRYDKEIPKGILEAIQRVADKEQVNFLGFASYAIIASIFFSSNAMVNKNLFMIMESPVGDRDPYLKTFSSFESGVKEAVSILIKKEKFPNAVYSYYKAIIDYQASWDMAELPPPPARVGLPTADKVDPLQPEAKIILSKKTMTILGLIVTLLGGISFFIPQLKPISMMISAVVGILKQLFGG